MDFLIWMIRLCMGSRVVAETQDLRWLREEYMHTHGGEEGG